MTDDRKQYIATPAATLEQRVMDPRIEKSETEWWAHREIKLLRDEVEQWKQERVDTAEFAFACRREAESKVQQLHDHIKWLLAHIADAWDEGYTAAQQDHEAGGRQSRNPHKEATP